MWQNPPKNISLNDQDVHIWHINLAGCFPFTSDLIDILSTEEQHKANRFIQPILQQRYRILHIALRLILSRYLFILPEKIQFYHGTHGKPYVANQKNKQIIYFNASDSVDRAVCAITLNREIGIDIEFKRKNIEILKIAERFFSPEEFYFLSKQSVHDRLDNFYRVWTRKEAYLKAIGLGLSFPLKDFSVSLDQNNKRALLHVRHESMAHWTVGSIISEEEFESAIAVEGDAKLSFYEFSSHF